MSNEIGGDNLQKSVYNAGVAGKPAVKSVNRYSLNNSKLEVFNEDLATKATVDGLIMYALKSRANQLAWELAKPSYPEEAEPPVAGVMVGLGCDGDPNRSSEVVDLRKLDTTVSGIIEARDNEIKLRTSTNSRDFKEKYFTKAAMLRRRRRGTECLFLPQRLRRTSRPWSIS